MSFHNTVSEPDYWTEACATQEQGGLRVYDVPPLNASLCLGGPHHGKVLLGAIQFCPGYARKFLVNIFFNTCPVLIHESLMTQAEVLRAVQSTKYSVAFGTDNITPL